MRGDEAKKVCPDIHLVQVPVARGKADLTVYRNAGSEVVSILSKKGRCERASIDEVYLDLTEAVKTMLAENPLERLEAISEEAHKSHVLGLHILDGTNTRDCVREWFLRSDADHRDRLLACGALIVAELRLEVLRETQFTCSAGIAHNKMLAKLASGMNKPAQQTIVPLPSVKKLLESLPIKKMKQLGGKLGTSLQADLAVNTVGDLLQFSADKLQESYGINTGTWLWNIARGICGEEVESRLLSKSHGSGKTFPGSQALKTISSVQKWLYELCEELNERILCDLEQNKRIARTLTLHASAYKLNDSESLKKFPSKSCPLRYGIAKIQEDALNLFHAGLREYIGVYHVSTKENKHHEWAITGLSVSASKIVVIPSGTHSIMKYFHNENQPCTSTYKSDDACSENAAFLSSSVGVVALDLADPLTDTYEDEARAKNEMEVCKARQDAPFTMTSADNKGPLIIENNPLSCSGSENDLGSKPTQSKTEVGLKSEKQKRKFEKGKGNTSILRFFQSPEAHDKTFEEESDSWRYKSDEIDPTVLNELPPEIQAEVRASLQPQKRANTVKRGSSIAHYFSRTTNS